MLDRHTELTVRVALALCVLLLLLFADVPLLLSLRPPQLTAADAAEYAGKLNFYTLTDADKENVLTDVP